MPKLLREIVAGNIKAIRVQAGMTQVELAKKAKMTDVYISRVEQNAKNLTLDSVEQIAAALGVPIGGLVDYSGQPLPKIKSASAKSLRHAIRVLEAYVEAIEK